MENLILELQEENLYFETMEELERYYRNIDAVKNILVWPCILKIVWYALNKETKTI